MPSDTLSDSRSESRSPGEKRRFKRAPLTVTAEVIPAGANSSGPPHDGAPMPAVVVDLSLGGVRIRTPCDMQEAAGLVPGCKLTLGLGGTLYMECQTIWRQHDRLGLAFMHRTEEVAPLITGLLPPDCHVPRT